MKALTWIRRTGQVWAGHAPPLLIIAAAALINPGSRLAAQIPVGLDPFAVDRLLFERYYTPELRWLPIFTRDQGLNKAGLSPAHRILDAARLGPGVVRAELARAVGRFENPADVPFLIGYLADAERRVRLEAANAVAQALHDPDAPGAGTATAQALQALKFQLVVEPDEAAAAMMLEVLGELRLNESDAREVERLLFQQTRVTLPIPDGFGARKEGALRGLVQLLRNNRSHQLARATREGLRQLALPGSFGFKEETGPNQWALAALVLARDDNAILIRAAVNFRCRERPDCGWEYRRFGLQLITVPKPEFMSVLRAALGDHSLRVRIEALRAFARDRSLPRSCGVFVDAMNDRSLHVVLEALTLLDAECPEHQDVADRLVPLAEELGDSFKSQKWHVPAGALEALVRFRPAVAQKITNETAAVHERWQVRALAARLAAVFNDEPMARTLARDPSPNVRSDALESLHKVRSPALSDEVHRALESDDHQLLLYAATLLKVVDATGTTALLVERALDRVSRAANEGQDVSSRETRVELLKRMRQVSTSSEPLLEKLQTMLADFDPEVAVAVADLLQHFTGTRPPTPLPPEQQIVAWRAKLEEISGCHSFTMRTGERFSIVHARFSAPPISAMMFSRAASSNYYDGLTFHRVTPLGFIEGGSPAASYYKGNKFIRDEINLRRHTRGTVGLSRHARHTGNLQFFINLVDNPALDREFTVVGSIGRCVADDPPPQVMLDNLDRLLPGAEIATVTPHVIGPIR